MVGDQNFRDLRISRITPFSEKITGLRSKHQQRQLDCGESLKKEPRLGQKISSCRNFR